MKYLSLIFIGSIILSCSKEKKGDCGCTASYTVMPSTLTNGDIYYPLPKDDTFNILSYNDTEEECLSKSRVDKENQSPDYIVTYDCHLE